MMVLDFIKSLFKKKEVRKEDKGASVPFMITRDMRQQLYDLGYARRDVDVMHVLKATHIIKIGMTKQ